MNRPLLTIFWLNVILISLNAQTFYNWPCAPFDQQHDINGTFCENRPSGSILIHHFHDGVDIHLPQNSNVYSVINGSITSLGYVGSYGINAFVRVGRYAYVHVDPSPAVQVGTPITAYQTIIGTTNSWNHIHFKDGYVGAEINALRADGGLSPIIDNYPPYIDAVNYYINATTIPFANKKVSGLVEIVAKARDKTDSGPLGNNNGIYSIGYQIYDESGQNALTDSIQNLVFSQIPPSDSYVTNVFFEGSDISNYYYTITNPITSDGYWDTRQFAPGNYKIKVFTDDSKLNTKEYWSSVEVVEQDIYPPADPEIAGLVGDNNKQWILSWLPNDSTDIAGYELHISYDGLAFFLLNDISNQIQAGDSSLIWDDFVNDETIYFKLKTYDGAAIPNFSDFSDAYGTRLSTAGPQVLLVDAFDRIDGYWSESSHEFNPVYGNILAELNLPFNSSSDDAVSANRVAMNDYQNVIYFLGDESTHPPVLSQSEQESIMDYLKQGGNLFICGSEIGYGLVTNGSESDSMFYSDYLKAKFLSDSATTFFIEGVSGTSFSGISAEITPIPGTVLRPDVITANEGSIPILTFANGSVAAIHYRGIVNQGTSEANVVYFTFPLELINDENTRRILLERVFELFGVSTNIFSHANDESVKSFKLFDNYPNPFNPQTKIHLKLPTADQVSLDIFSIDGRHVKTLYNQNLDAGTHVLTWNGTDDTNQQVSSGVYIYRLKTSKFQQAKKMMLIR